MKKTLFLTAILGAALCSTAMGALTINYDTTSVEKSLATDFTVRGCSYNATTGLLTGATVNNDFASAITFVLNNSKLSAATPDTNTGLIYVNAVNTTDSANWGFDVTSDKGIKGRWQGTDWGSSPTIAQSDIAGYATEGKVTLTASLNSGGTGTRLFVGDSEEGTEIYNQSKLTSAGRTVQSIYANKDYIDSITVLAQTAAHVSAGNWSKDYATFADTAISTTPVAGTLVIGGRLQANGGANGNAATLNTNGGDIVVGNAGQLFLQTWGAGAIELNNDIYLGGSTHADAGTYGALRIGSDGGTVALNGAITLVENAAMSTTNSGASKRVDVNGKVSGAYELTIKNAKELYFNGGIDVSKLVIGAGSVNIASTLKSSGALQVNDNTTISTTDASTSTLGTFLALDTNKILTIDGKAALQVNGAQPAHGIWMKAGSSIKVGADASLSEKTAGLTFKGATITNTAASEEQIGIHSSMTGGRKNIVIAGDTTVNAGITNVGNYTLQGGKLTVNTGTETAIAATLSANDAKTDLLVTNGSAANFSAESLVLKDVTMEAGTTIGVNNHNGTLALDTLTVTGSGATVNANLDLTGAKINLHENTVKLGCDITLGNTQIFVTYEQVDYLYYAGQDITLFTDVESLTLANVGTYEYTSPISADRTLSGITFDGEGNQPFLDMTTVYVNLNADKTVTLSLTARNEIVPEPATATLSLLALAALAARRRRH